MRLARPRPTIRSRLTGAATAATMLMLAVASVAIITIQRQALTAGVDEALRQRADNLEPIDPTARELPGEGDPEDSFAQLLDTAGSVLASSGNIADSPTVLVSAGDLRSSRFTTATLARPKGRYRVLIRPVNAGPNERILVVGKNLDDVTERAYESSSSPSQSSHPSLRSSSAFWPGGSPGGRCSRSKPYARRYTASTAASCTAGSPYRKPTTRSRSWHEP